MAPRITTARNVFWGICRNTYSARSGCGIRHGAGSRATAGHQNRSALPRNSRCSRSWTSGSSSAASNSGEKWLPHITAAKITQATTGKARTRTTREWRTGRIQRPRVSCDDTRRISVIGAARASSGAATSVSRTCWIMWTEKSVVS